MPRKEKAPALMPHVHLHLENPRPLVVEVFPSLPEATAWAYSRGITVAPVQRVVQNPFGDFVAAWCVDYVGRANGG